MNISMNGLNASKMLTQSVFAKLKKCTEIAFSPKYLFFTNVGVSFALSGIGDVLEQRYELYQGDLNKWDRSRTLKMALSGIPVGIVCHHYYTFLDRRLPGRSLTILAKKVIIDQIICSPLCISTFLITVAYLEGNTLREFVEELKKKAWRLYAAEWVIWPPAQVINFYFLPTKYRVIFDSTISLGYDVYTSYVKHDNHTVDTNKTDVKS